VDYCSDIMMKCLPTLTVRSAHGYDWDKYFKNWPKNIIIIEMPYTCIIMVKVLLYNYLIFFELNVKQNNNNRKDCHYFFIFIFTVYRYKNNLFYQHK